MTLIYRGAVPPKITLYLTALVILRGNVCFVPRKRNEARGEWNVCFMPQKNITPPSGRPKEAMNHNDINNGSGEARNHTTGAASLNVDETPGTGVNELSERQPVPPIVCVCKQEKSPPAVCSPRLREPAHVV